MTNRTLAILAVAVGLVGMLLVGLLVGMHMAQPDPPELDTQAFEEIAEQGARDKPLPLKADEPDQADQPEADQTDAPPARPDGLKFDSAAERERKIKSLLGMSRLDVLAAFPDALPRQSLAAPTTELAARQLAEQVELAERQPDAAVAVDTIYTYWVDTPEPGLITVTIREGKVTEARFVRDE